MSIKLNFSHIISTRKILFIISLCLMLLGADQIFAQNDIQLSQQMFSRINYNPAATGITEDIHLYMLARQQWVGFKDAPQTIVINGHTFVPWTRSGWGFSLIGDMLGYEKSFNPKIRYAFHIPFSKSKSSLSLGIGAGVMYKTIDANNLVYENPADPNRLFGTQDKVKPDFDFGFEYNSKFLNTGASITHLGNNFNDSESTENSPHLYVYARGLFDLNKNWQITPGLSLHNSKSINQIEVNTLFFYKRVFWVGASYRIKESLVFLAGAYLSPNIMLGYSYDFNAHELSPYSNGSHEIMLSWKIPQPQKARKARRMRECYHAWW
ncbi:MAG: PorP/SprF family type IX secretion system membrane protein [Bacteroidales bacterium]|jgi:type IX secretion system PorP/SprF family membrane protein|nr:PorP/SprF family type IX secretion system membrane protein [Bacteroidales bacterium]